MRLISMCLFLILSSCFEGNINHADKFGPSSETTTLGRSGTQDQSTSTVNDENDGDPISTISDPENDLLPEEKDKLLFEVVVDKQGLLDSQVAIILRGSDSFEIFPEDMGILSLCGAVPLISKVAESTYRLVYELEQPDECQFQLPQGFKGNTEAFEPTDEVSVSVDLSLNKSVIRYWPISFDSSTHQPYFITHNGIVYVLAPFTENFQTSDGRSVVKADSSSSQVEWIFASLDKFLYVEHFVTISTASGSLSGMKLEALAEDSILLSSQFSGTSVEVLDPEGNMLSSLANQGGKDVFFMSMASGGQIKTLRIGSSNDDSLRKPLVDRTNNKIISLIDFTTDLQITNGDGSTDLTVSATSGDTGFIEIPFQFTGTKYLNFGGSGDQIKSTMAYNEATNNVVVWVRTSEFSGLTLTDSSDSSVVSPFSAAVLCPVAYCIGIFSYDLNLRTLKWARAVNRNSGGQFHDRFLFGYGFDKDHNVVVTFNPSQAPNDNYVRDENGNILLTWTGQGSANNFFILKFSESGSVLWHQLVRANYSASTWWPEVYFTDSDDVWLLGAINMGGGGVGQLRITNGTTTHNLTKSIPNNPKENYIALLDKNGVFGWGKMIGGSETAKATILDDTSVVISGRYRTSKLTLSDSSGTDHTPSSPVPVGNDAYFFKISLLDGTIGWLYTLNCPNNQDINVKGYDALKMVVEFSGVESGCSLRRADGTEAVAFSYGSTKSQDRFSLVLGTDGTILDQKVLNTDGSPVVKYQLSETEGVRSSIVYDQAVSILSPIGETVNILDPVSAWEGRLSDSGQNMGAGSVLSSQGSISHWWGQESESGHYVNAMTYFDSGGIFESEPYEASTLRIELRTPNP